jgi:hypothetical protein
MSSATAWGLLKAFPLTKVPPALFIAFANEESASIAAISTVARTAPEVKPDSSTAPAGKPEDRERLSTQFWPRLLVWRTYLLSTQDMLESMYEHSRFPIPFPHR